MALRMNTTKCGSKRLEFSIKRRKLKVVVVAKK